MSKLWYREIGFYNNPFSIKPASFHDELIAYDLDYIYSKIDNGQMIFIDGTYGSGKTTILKNIINRYRGDKKVIYYNYNLAKKDFNIKNLIKGSNSFINKIMGIKPHNIILLLDEIKKLKKNNAKQTLKYYHKGIIKSVIFVNNDYYEVDFPEEIEDLLDGNVIRTAKLSEKEAIALIRRRIGNIKILSDEIIKKIFARSEKNPRKLLENCEDICRHAIEEEMEDVVTQDHIKEVIGREEKKKKEKFKNEKKIKKKKESQKKKQQSKKETKKTISAKTKKNKVPEYNIVFYNE
ncbi:AAA family ATPase [Candidatus Woesearchaeota archaeon]|nr:AAA family ATPase [Candidatus Woesearchaeota archaeon]